MLDTLLGSRSAESILSGRATVVLGGEAHSLPDLPHGANKAWLRSIDDGLAGLMSNVEAAGDDMPSILAALMDASDLLLDTLYSYDRGEVDGKPTREGVLPPRDQIEAVATDREILLAVLGVWQAANPLVAIALAGAGLGALTSGTRSEPTPTSRRRTAGRSRTSKAN